MANHPSRRRRSGGLTGLVQRGFEFFSRSIWELELAQLSRARALLYKLARVAFLAARGFVNDRCLMRAAALTYVTILSIVPLLAVSFAAAKGLGFYQELIDKQVDPFLDKLFGTREGRDAALASAAQPDGAQPDGAQLDRGQPDGEQVEGEQPDGEQKAPPTEEGLDLRESIDEVLARVEQTDFTALGWPALVLFLYTIVKMLSTVEASFNQIWGATRPRTILRKVSDYVSLVIVTPILLFVGAGVAAATRDNPWVREHLGLGSAIQFLLDFSSLFAVWAGFTFLYVGMPNTRVRLGSAALGGLVASVLWVVVQVVHVEFQVGIARYNALYSGLAVVPILMVWANVCWIVVLLGAEIANAHQSEPTYREVERPYPTAHAFREVVALRAAARIARRFAVGGEPATARELALELGVPVRPVQEVLSELERRGVLAGTALNADVAYLPARPLEALTLKSVLDALRGAVGPEDAPPRAPLDAELDRLLAGLDEELAGSDRNCTLAELAAHAGGSRAAQRELGLRGQGSARSAAT